MKRLFCLLAALALAAPTFAGITARSIATLQADLDQPSAVTIAADGRAYVVDGVNARIAVFDASGAYDFSFGRADELNLPMGITIAGDNVYVADTGNHRLAVYDGRGRFLRQLPLPAGSAGPAEPIAVHVRDGILAWTDRRNHRLCRTATSGAPLGCTGRRGQAESQFQFPFQLASDRAGYLHVVDVLNGRVQSFHPKGRFYGLLGRFGTGPGELYRPNGVAIDSEDRLFVSDTYLGTVSVFEHERFRGLLLDARGRPLRFDAPVGLASWRDRLYVVEAGANRVSVLHLTANAVTAAVPAIGSDSRKNCVMCHLAWEPGYSGGYDEDGIDPVASARMCYSCHHGAVVDSRRQIGRAGQHPDIHHRRPPKSGVPAQRKDEIPKAFPRHGKQLYCGSCHTPHGTDTEAPTLRPEHRNPWLRVLNKNGDLCARCHASKVDDVRAPTRPNKGITHPLGVRLAAPPAPGAEGYARDKAVHEGLPEALTTKGGAVGSARELECQSCHQIHGGASDQLLVLDNRSGALCGSCHERQDTTDRKHARRKGMHPVNIKLDELIDFRGDKLRELRCTTCHSVHDGTARTALLSGKATAEKLCAECHERQHAAEPRAARLKGVHPIGIELDKPVKVGDKEVKRLGCLSCHSVHNGKPDTAALVEDPRDGKFCARCHERHSAEGEKDARKKGVHGVNFDLEKPVKIGDDEVKRIVCGTCHRMHKGKPETPALVEDHRDARLCSYCHDAQKAVVQSDHDLRVSANTVMNRFDQWPAESGACGACHTLHRGEGKAPFLYAGAYAAIGDKENAGPRDRLCLDCHSGRKPKTITEFTHPYRDLILRSDPKVLPLLDTEDKNVEFGRIGCVTCHDPHRWAPKQQGAVVQKPTAENLEGDARGSFLRRKGAEGTFCIDCHGAEARVKWGYFHDGQGRGKGIDYLK